MTDTSRIAAWLDARAPHDALLSMTVHEIIVALLARIEALEADVAALKAVAPSTFTAVEWRTRPLDEVTITGQVTLSPTENEAKTGSEESE